MPTARGERPAGFEDGTTDFLGLPAVTIGLHHSNGSPMVRILGPTTMEERGATIAFLLLDPAGEPYEVGAAQSEAVEQAISLRTGCFCNPGDGEVAHHLTRDDMAPCFFTPAPPTFDQRGSIIRQSTGKTPNTMRVSLGVVSNFADVFAFVRFAAGFRDRPAPTATG
jgi:selenocysteine lyase/cysteine desulfurase